MGEQELLSSQNTQHLSIKFNVLYGHSSWHLKTIIVVRLKHSSKITMTNIIIMKKFEILWELPKCNTETTGEQMLLEKLCWKACLMQGCHSRPSFCKKNKIKKIYIYITYVYTYTYLQRLIKQNKIKQGMPVCAIFNFFWWRNYITLIKVKNSKINKGFKTINTCLMY